MKKLKILLLALSLIVPALMAPAPASAEVVLNQRDAFTLILSDSCTGEVVTVIGETHRVIRSRVGNDGTTHFDIHVDSHGEGIGNSSGKRAVNDTCGMTRVMQAPTTPLAANSYTALSGMLG